MWTVVTLCFLNNVTFTSVFFSNASCWTLIVVRLNLTCVFFSRRLVNLKRAAKSLYFFQGLFFILIIMQRWLSDISIPLTFRWQDNWVFLLSLKWNWNYAGLRFVKNTECKTSIFFLQLVLLYCFFFCERKSCC